MLPNGFVQFIKLLYMQGQFRCLMAIIFSVLLVSAHAQTLPGPEEVKWVDSVFKTLTRDQKIGQLMMVRMSTIGSNQRAKFFDKEVEEAVLKYNIGGVCLFQGGPREQAMRINYLQSISKTPILFAIDAETGLGMRLDSVAALPRQMMLGAMQDPSIVYQYGHIVGEQCKRMGIQVNFAPVADINNNPANPVINDRSFGQDRSKVASYAIEYMKGLQDAGVMACAKHFPGHGDVSVDSHLDLPQINKSRKQLDSLELYPFRQMVKAGVSSVMVAHLQVPAIDNRPNRPTSLSAKAVNGILRHELGFTGLIFTDALEMKGVSKFYPAGEASAQALIAGNDMLCLPGDIPGSIARIKKAIASKKLSWKYIDAHVRRVLHAKYQYGLSQWKPVEIHHLTADLNDKLDALRRTVAEHAITLLKNDDPAIFPLASGKRVAYVGVGVEKDNAFARQLRQDYNANVFYFPYETPADKVQPLLDFLKDQYDVVLIGMHNYSRFPGKGDFGISPQARELIQKLQQQFKTITLGFGNPYAMAGLCDSRVLLACYQDDDITQQAAADLVYGRFLAKGKLPVSICPRFVYGSGIVPTRLLPEVSPAALGFDVHKLTQIDSIVEDAIRQRAIPGAVVLVAKDGKIAYERAYGFMTYDSIKPVYPETIYDLASVTKIMATTVSVMKLYDEGKIDLQKTLGDYLPWVRGTNKEHLKIWDIMLHQAGLKAWIPFYKETVDPADNNAPLPEYYSYEPDSLHSVRVAAHMYLRHDWVDTMYQRILTSEVGPIGQYVYSDNDFIFMGKIVEAVTGMPLNEYVKKTFYDPLQMSTTGFLPAKRFPLDNIAPTEEESGFRQQLIHGDVHDPGSAMFGGVAGHAGLFSDAYDLAVLGQLFLNGGTENGYHFFKPSTVQFFSAYHSDISRRGIGFDKPDPDNANREEPYPAPSASPQTFGHTGFTGTCVWFDPTQNLTYIFLSNRVNNNGDANRFLRMNVRGKVMETIYESLRLGKQEAMQATR